MLAWLLVRRSSLSWTARWRPALFVFVVVFILKTRNPDVVLRRNFGVGFLCPDLDALQIAFSLRLPQKDQVVLVVEVFLETIEVRFEADRVRSAEGVAFASGFVRNPGKTSEAEVKIR